MQSENTADLATALAKAQGQMENAEKDKENPHFKSKYASLAAVLDAIRKPFAENGLSHTQVMECRESGLVLVTTLRHGGQWIASEYPLPMGVRPQEFGSALTYARRYSLSAIAGVTADEDDDANAEQSSGRKTAAPVAKNPIKPAPTAEPSPRVKTGMAMLEVIKVAKSSKDVIQWKNDNQVVLDDLETNAPKVFDRVMAEYDNALAKLDPVAA
jgi:hypothetical protein